MGIVVAVEGGTNLSWLLRVLGQAARQSLEGVGTAEVVVMRPRPPGLGFRVDPPLEGGGQDFLVDQEA